MASVLDKFIFLFILSNIYCFDLILAHDYKKNGLETSNGEAYSGMWFGPRLGKRALTSENERQAFYRLLEEADSLKDYYNQLPYYDQADDPKTRAVTKKVIFTPKLGRSADEDNFRRLDNVNFTPRLGRRLPDKMGVTLSDTDIVNEDPQPITNSNKNRYFSPRLGRTMTFSPRLGRDLIYDVFQPDSIRVVRSADKKTEIKKSTTT